VQLQKEQPRRPAEGFLKDSSKWVIFPKLSYLNHKKIEEELLAASEIFSGYSHNLLIGSGKKGIAAGGVSYQYVCEALEGAQAEYKLLKVSTIPFPETLGAAFLDGLDEVLVAEELDPVIEQALIRLCGRRRMPVTIRGKLTDDMPNAGENTVAGVRKAVERFLGLPETVYTAWELPNLPVRPPVLCAGCPHRGSFFAVKEAVKGRKAVFSGDIGCYTLGNAKPLDMVDTCLCMGAGITVAQGLNRVEPDTINFAFVGDSTFFHSGLPGLINAVYNGADVIIAILDNRTTAMTGNQPHPGIGRTATGQTAPKLDIYSIVSSLGVSALTRVNAFDLEASKQAVREMMEITGVRVILFEGPCIAVEKGETPCAVDKTICTGCKICIRKLGCPALSMEDAKAKIDPTLCTGCKLCQPVCVFSAIGGARAC
jgi:indolepyruvate ferredoxin oxidoreductase alpha subunit